MPVDAPASKILIVDDEPDIVAYLEHLLAGLGYATLSAGNGKEALEKAAAESPDLILMDVTMPVMDGITACAALKGKDETRLTPIVIMTGILVEDMSKSKLLAELDLENIPNIKNQRVDILKRDLDNRYSAPYMWGTTGIIVNRDYVRENVTWKTLWNQ
ncbi:MAG: response regulator, partial [candidate division NC10 bacterium]